MHLRRGRPARSSLSVQCAPDRWSSTPARPKNPRSHRNRKLPRPLAEPERQPITLSNPDVIRSLLYGGNSRGTAGESRVLPFLSLVSRGRVLFRSNNYRRRTGVFAHVREGARLGFATGVMIFFVSLLLFAFALLLAGDTAGLAEAMRQQIGQVSAPREVEAANARNPAKSLRNDRAPPHVAGDVVRRVRSFQRSGRRVGREDPREGLASADPLRAPGGILEIRGSPRTCKPSIRQACSTARPA